ncbi:iron-hydroxamate ABC transporter substrate-binding protein [Gracilibacillus sp. S3-1-1]|uniref:Iron-hydroxamate ABC transporter substrate-binding protein n=1 Tax=Gracilibacillus pellucidus TaxID=3095368 RepID=A0ACC6M670_9BACI|nr:iron-hydroxamate ABC transporter substrate-binding protein [Gracilibacillus sp. S3-1-1]MDX8046470.1 iron-hydroxamate ABC transporter substrate-binding protein [Gracilibacillus sp. S3-1-1]
MQKKHYFFMFILILTMSILSACGSDVSSQSEASEEGENTQSRETVTYESETGPVEIPAEPKRIVALSNAPNVHALDGELVGVDKWTKGSPLLADELADVPVVSENEPETVMAQNPDLIIAGSTMENLDELQKIAPTVIYTWGKLDYLEQQVEIGKLLNKEEEAQEWVQEFKERTATLGEKIKEKYGEDVSVSVFEVDAKNFYVFGDAWARGTEALYQAMDLNMSEKVQEDALEDGYHTLSLEVLPEYAGDFIVISKKASEENEFMQSDTWNSIPAVKKGHVIEIDQDASSYSDPITLKYLVDTFEEGFLGE